MSDSEYLWGLTYGLAFLAAVVALPVTWFLLRRYKLSILRLMSAGGDVGSAVSAPVEPGPATERFSAEPTDLDETVITRGIRRNVTVVVGIAALGGLAFAVLFLTATGSDITPYSLSFFTVSYAWPAVFGIWIVAGADRRWTWGSIAIYFVILIMVGLLGGLGLDDPLIVWAGTLVPTVATIPFLSRPLRGVGTLVLGSMMAGIMGLVLSQALFMGIIGPDTLRTLWVEIAAVFGVSDFAVLFYATQAAGLLWALVVAVLVIKWLAGWYSRHGFSDQMLLLGSVFLVFAIDDALSAGPSNLTALGMGMGIYAALGVFAFVLYRGIHRPPSQPSRLLMLRVFSPHPGAQRLLDRIGARWRYLGPVWMIGGPDLAVASVEPHEFLTFIGGRLRSLFINSDAALEDRLGSLSTRPDPDARFRIEEFFCFDDTWRQTVAGLLEHSDAVLMDLRGFGAENDGCIAEIEMLNDLGAMSRTVLLVDATTDRGLLDRILGPATGTTPTILTVDDDDRAVEVVSGCLTAAGAGVASGSRFLESD